ncbi:hypothetical protein Ami103574_02585 [Aminipila butyrica]|uniref:Uncharacterized protein n=1 Tax=Aminipila butyrica TaxID=433296 RepID=A0A858BW12_9FIRM|nr:hypothetical protein [Aminipila butyrica]QIB68266.1 hypothetical protein Ami103574_02585 [Aminipila butyrica]
MKDLSFNTGMIELAIQGDENRVLRFNPSDEKIADGFLNLVKTVNGRMKGFEEREKKIAEDSLTDLERAENMVGLGLEIDKFFRSELDGLFGEGTSSIVFENLSTFAITENGQCVFANFLAALLPFFEKETKVRSEKVAQIVRENRP